MKSAVKESASITAVKALELRVIDLIAPDIVRSFAKIERPRSGWENLKTGGAEVSEIKMSASEHMFQKSGGRR